MLDKLEVNRFFKVLKKMSNDLDINGIKVNLTDNKQVRTIRDVDIETPLFKIDNPKNIPFSYNSLKELLVTELITINQFAGTNFSPQILERLFNFNDFYVNDFYIPPQIEKRLINCLNHHEANVKYRIHNIIYTIYCEYIVDSNFEMYWDSSEEFRIFISLKLDEVFVDDVGSGDFYAVTDKDEMDRILYRITEQEPSFTFEDPVWHCFKDYLVDYPTFIDTQWQYINISVIPI